jgi:hypothetical protein
MKNFISALTIFSIFLFTGCNSEITKTSVATEVESEAETTNLSTQEILDLAYLDELKAEATYEYVMEAFGEVRPFSNIINAEVRHSQSILNLYEQLSLNAPEFEGIEDPAFNSIQEACGAGVIAEEENIALYDELMAQTNDQNILSVFRNLQSASAEKHLPAFQNCSK